jgi:L-asparaginase / beta-aspartyl-peptidase
MSIALIVHGGAGAWRPGSEDDAIIGTRVAVEAGRKILVAGGSALDAACAAAVILEDNPIFNAGTGSVLNIDGFAECDACVMLSDKHQVGAVAALQRVKNPIIVARQVMESTDHVMLGGEGALRFARAMGHAEYDLTTTARHADWTDKKVKIEETLGSGAMQTLKFLKSHPEYAGGTIGAVAVDQHGVICSATSTGGVTMKMVGRIGDTPIPGAGTYASQYIGASATGTGEYVIRSLSCRQISDNVAKGMSIDTAVDSVLDQLGRDFDGDIGLIAIDANGVPYANHRTRDMPHAYFSGGGEIVAKMRFVKF